MMQFSGLHSPNSQKKTLCLIVYSLVVEFEEDVKACVQSSGKVTDGIVITTTTPQPVGPP